MLEDTDGDGRADKFTVFADGLNIPSGIAVGHGGVWVANSPDILFLQDTDGDGRADQREVVVTGFGRRDTHELPNSLTWGPDGWLYGLNGVFNHSHVEHHGKTYDFTCALFRIHPADARFRALRARARATPGASPGTPKGARFVSACVIDHLWHLTETGYYHRQGGPYPPFTWKIESIVKHKHQKAAYCGIHYFDSDAYPPEYRDRLYMGNIHGNCINVDALARDGSTYLGTPEPDFLTANDAWFMPVVQKTGPDGCLYILDWYDRYHCYQDADRDPAGHRPAEGAAVSRALQGHAARCAFDLAQETDDQLIERLHSPNVYDPRHRPAAAVGTKRSGHAHEARALVLDDVRAAQGADARPVGAGRLRPAGRRIPCQALGARRRGLSRLGRAGGGQRASRSRRRCAKRVAKLADDPSPDVRLQVAIAATKIEGLDAVPLLVDVLAASGDDQLIPHIVWQNLHPLLEEHADEFVAAALRADPPHAAQIAKLFPRVVERLVARDTTDFAPLAALVERLVAGKLSDHVAGRAMPGDRGGQGPISRASRREAGCAARRARTGVGQSPRCRQRRPAVSRRRPLVRRAGATRPATPRPRDVLTSTKHADARRLQALDALVAASKPPAASDTRSSTTWADCWRRRPRPPSNCAAACWLRSRGSTDPRVAEVVLATYARLEPDLKPQAIELLTGRAAWSKALLAADRSPTRSTPRRST